MKKLLLLLTVAAFFGACSENTVDLQTEQSRAIDFTNLRGRITRATHAGANDSQDDYKVYASNELSATTWYINDTIDGTTNVAKNGPYYWLNNTLKYNFYAYAPASLKASGAPGLLQIVDYTVPADAQQDFTIAVPRLDLDYDHSNNGRVDLVFHHVLAKININVDLADNLKNAGYSVEQNYTADLEVLFNKANAVFIDPTQINMTWDNFQRSSTGANVVYSGKKSYMILPQGAYEPTLSNACSVTLRNIVIKKNGITVFPVSVQTGDLSKLTFDASNMSEKFFNQGTMYNLNFQINDLSTNDNGELILGEKIKFSATHADWTSTSVDLVQP